MTTVAVATVQPILYVSDAIILWGRRTDGHSSFKQLSQIRPYMGPQQSQMDYSMTPARLMALLK